MTKQIIFIISVLITLGVFTFTVSKIVSFFKLTKANFPIRDFWKRIVVTLKVVFLQTKIFRMPVLGFLHAMIWWGFLVILIGTVEMAIDGITGTERVLSVMGSVYDVIIAVGDVYGFLILIATIVFLFRRLFLNVRRFSGIEMKHISHKDANLALSIIIVLMITLLGMNASYIAINPEDYKGVFPISSIIAKWFVGLSPESLHSLHETNWWSHILLIFIFVNILPYSKHFHVFMSAPNVFLSRLQPLGYITNMDNVTKEVQLMMDPNAAFAEPPEGEQQLIERFGVMDVEDVSWKNYFDSLACTECGRCTSVCPANITGKMLSPRKVLMDLRARMKEKGPGLLKDKGFTDNKSLLRDYIREEELWACTTCNACAQECPININHPSLIVDLRRYLVMEEAAAPGELNAMFSNIENNGAPWQFSPEDRMLWAEGLEVPVLANKFNDDKKPEYLYWVGSAGAFDDRYKKVSREFVKVLNHLKIDYAVLGTEETDSGDIARRSGNEMLFQMQALQIIEIFKMYGVRKIITCDPHDYNTFLNEYPDLGGKYEVIHHTQFLQNLIADGKLKIDSEKFKDQTIVFHDPCYLGRANEEYKAPRNVLKAIPSLKVEMKRNRSFALCCGAGGGQMFKECEKGDKEIFIERTEEALETKADIIATACPFCMVMITDGLKYKNKEEEILNFDIAELVAQGLGL